MPEHVTIEHIRDIVIGACAPITARLDGLQHQIDGGFKGTHARISDQASDIRGLTGQVAKTNGQVLKLRSDVDRIEKSVDTLEDNVGQERERSLREAAEFRNFLHKRKTDRADAPPVEHARAVEIINEHAPLTPAFFRKYWKVIVGAVGGAGTVGYVLGRWLERLGVSLPW